MKWEIWRVVGDDGRLLQSLLTIVMDFIFFFFAGKKYHWKVLNIGLKRITLPALVRKDLRALGRE